MARPAHGISPLALKLSEVWEESIHQPMIRDDETLEQYHTRENDWRKRKLETARLIYFLTHQGNDTAARYDFLTEFVY